MKILGSEEEKRHEDGRRCFGSPGDEVKAAGAGLDEHTSIGSKRKADYGVHGTDILSDLMSDLKRMKPNRLTSGQGDDVGMDHGEEENRQEGGRKCVRRPGDDANRSGRN